MHWTRNGAEGLAHNTWAVSARPKTDTLWDDIRRVAKIRLFQASRLLMMSTIRTVREDLKELFWCTIVYAKKTRIHVDLGQPFRAQGI